MNREIKFRAFFKDNGVMVYNHSVCMQVDGTVSYLSASGEWTEDRLKLIPLMQFTGFKDASGNDIYDGDIFKSVNRNEIYKVEWQNHTWWATPISTSGRGRKLALKSGNIIIGNIYENPELLAA